LPELAGWAVEVGADVVELNGSCPNEGEHEVLCNDTEKTLEAIDRVRSKIGNEIYLTLKVSPLEHDTIRRYVEAKVAVDGIVAVNNQRRLSPYDPATEQSVIEVKDGYAGQSGPVISLSARRNLKAWLAAGEDRYELWSIGGIDNGHEALLSVTPRDVSSTFWLSPRVASFLRTMSMMASICHSPLPVTFRPVLSPSSQSSSAGVPLKSYRLAISRCA
jgi:hypothetical protein